MTYIYPHNDPEILKLGIRMALYGEKKPEDNYVTGYGDPAMSVWCENSRIAYLKEPEFKVGDTVYY